MDSQEKKTITTPRLVLRAAQMTDVDDLFKVFSDGEVMKYWDTLPHAKRLTTERWVTRMVNSDYNGRTDFVICLKQEQASDNKRESKEAGEEQDPNKDELRVIGKIGVWKGIEIGFMLGRKYWRRGYGKEAVNALLDDVFGSQIARDENAGSECDSHEREEKPRMDSLMADVDPRNEACLALLQSFGFKEYDRKEKTFRVGNVWVDSVFLSLDLETWQKRKQLLKR